ncbi:putative cathepsin L [Rosa chinensis]|uniref:Putative cathepsin L n=1 Tax=Rosa chinensis TaxID=74649 RepID=A0A2P6RY27_ROSCH|nr:putative cathepsin L [Rosa chinensis]
MEGITPLTTGKLISLSKKELVDCDVNGEDQGCEGGLMDNAFEFINQNHGHNPEANYPYTGVDGTCGTSLDHGVTAVGYGIIDDGTKYWLVKNSWGAQQLHFDLKLYSDSLFGDVGAFAGLSFL